MFDGRGWFRTTDLSRVKRWRAEGRAAGSRVVPGMLAFDASMGGAGDAVGSGPIRLDSGCTAHSDVVDLCECRRKLMSMERREYDVLLVPEAEGGYSVFVPDLPSVATQGETVEEALDMARDAIEGYLEVMREEGRPVPTVRRERVAVETA
jgi:antitoxin HicB